MGKPRLIVTTPLLQAASVATVSEQPGKPAQVVRRTVDLLGDPLQVALAAREAGADVTFVGLGEPVMADLARRQLEGCGLRVDFIEVAAAGRQETTYVDGDGGVCFQVNECRVPSTGAVDRLLDRLERHLAAGAAFLVTAGDLGPVDGAGAQNFVERAIGRAWGFGVRTITAVGDGSLRQAFHAQPFAAFVTEAELHLVAPPPQGRRESMADTLLRVFEDPVRILLVLRSDGCLLAATRDATEELGPLGEIAPGVAMGALAAALIARPGDLLPAARQAYGDLHANQPQSGMTVHAPDPALETRGTSS